MTGRAALGEDYGYCFHGEATDTAPATVAPSKWRQLRTAKELLPEFGRFHACNEAAARGARGVSIYTKGESAWFGAVIRCGSVWICPVCARRISEGRKIEVQGAIDNAIKQGKGVMLVTLTFPHGAGDVLADILEKFAKAQRKFKSGRAAKDLRQSIGFVGEIRTLEVTHGDNGWHPHAHSIWVTDRQLTAEQQEQLRADLYAHWSKACISSGLPEPSEAHGVDVRGARYAGEYVAKWGFATEIAGNTSKRGKKESAGRTPWQLLADATEGDRRAAWLWREFAIAFFGRRQLFWSRGLRDTLGAAPELTDQQLMDLDDEKSQQVVMLDLETWDLVVKQKAHEVVLSYALNDRQGLIGYLNNLRSTVPWGINGVILGPREDWEL